MANNNRTEYKLAIKIHGEMAKSLPNSVKLTKSELRAISKEAVTSSKTMRSSFKDGLKSTEGVFNSIEKVGVKAFKTIAKTAATSATAIATASIKVGSEYESQMSTVKAISGATDSEFEALSKKAKTLGATTVFTAKEAGEAMEYEAMAGWKSSDMLKGTEGIMNLAAASGEDLATTADIVTDSLTAFKLKAKDSAHFSDILATSASNANTNVAKMGKTFEYVAPIAGSLGYSAEDVALDVGLMANNGIKASKAGTSLRAWLNRMAKPTKESQSAMDALNLSMTDSHGNMKSLKTLTKETITALQSVKDADKRTKYAGMLAGTTGMSGLLALVNSSEEDFKKLNKAIKECDGSAEEMANIKLDNLEGDIKLFTSALQGAGIEIYDEMKEPLRELVQSATDWVGDFAKNFKTELPSVIRTAKEMGGAILDFAEPFLEVGEWLLDNPDVIVGAIEGIGVALISYKVVSGVAGLASSLVELGTAGGAVLGVVGVVAVITGVTGAMKEAKREAAAQNLADHFGDVALSMDNVNDAARQIIGKGYLTQLDELMDSLDKGDTFIDSMNDALEEIRKTNWKVEAGITLKKGEVSDYKSSVKAYVKNAQDYISNQGYTVSIATKVLFGDGKESKKINLRNNQWYAGLEKEAKSIKKELNSYLKEAVKDGLDIDETATVEKLLGQLDKITSKLTDAQQQARMDTLDAKYSGVAMDADSFKNLEAELNSDVETSNEETETAFENDMATLRGQLNDKTITKKQFNKEKKKAQAALYERQAKAALNAQEFMLGKIEETYGDEIDPVIDGMKEIIQKVYNTSSYATTEEKAKAAQNEIKEFLSKSGLSADTQNALKTLEEYVIVNTDELNSIYKKAENNGSKISAKTYSKIQNANAENNELLSVIYEQPAYYSRVINKEYSEKDAETIQQSIETSFDKGFASGVKEAEQARTDIEKTYQDPLEVKIQVEVDDSAVSGTVLEDPSVISVVAPGANLSPVEDSDTSTSGKKKKKAKKHALGGIFTTPHLGMVAEAGYPESIIPIKNDSRSFKLWQETGRLLGVSDDDSSFQALEKKLRSFAESGINMSYSVSGSNSDTESEQPLEIHYSPQIIIQGNADKTVVAAALDDGYSKFEKYMSQYIRKKGRVSFAN